MAAKGMPRCPQHAAAVRSMAAECKAAWLPRGCRVQGCREDAEGRSMAAEGMPSARLPRGCRVQGCRGAQHGCRGDAECKASVRMPRCAAWLPRGCRVQGCRGDAECKAARLPSERQHGCRGDAAMRRKAARGCAPRLPRLREESSCRCHRRRRAIVGGAACALTCHLT